MAIAGKYEGKLIGYNFYAKEGKEYHTYCVLMTQCKDEKTGLYADCEIARVSEEKAVIENAKAGMNVTFYGENIKTKDGMFVRYRGIEAAKG